MSSLFVVWSHVHEVLVNKWLTIVSMKDRVVFKLKYTLTMWDNSIKSNQIGFVLLKV